VIRVADTGFDEQVLFDQDAVATEILQRPEFQKKMTTTERNYLLGKQFAEREKALGVAPGLLSTCAELELPVFVGAPADGSLFLNSVKLWALARMGKIQYGFDYDLHEDVFESCAYHHWGLFESDAKSFAILILGAACRRTILCSRNRHCRRYSFLRIFVDMTTMCRLFRRR